MVNTTTTTPDDFDVEGWLSDAEMPQESVTIYKRPDMVAELSDLKRRYNLERHAVEGESSVGEQENPVAEQYEEALRKFADSALTLYLRALTPDELVEISKQSDDDDKTHGFRVLAKSIVAVRQPNGEKRTVNWNAPMVKILSDKIGEPQAVLVAKAYNRAKDMLPIVDADFLRKSSGPASTGS